MLNILFFAQTRELIGCGSLNLPANFDTVEDLRCHLASKGDKWEFALQKGKILMAVNQKLCGGEQVLKDNDEIAFFPPVTGG